MKMLEFIQQKSVTQGAVARATFCLLKDMDTNQYQALDQATFFLAMFTTLAYVQQFGLPDDLTDYLEDVPDVADFPHWSDTSC